MPIVSRLPGTIYTATPTALSAWSNDTGQPAWPTPFTPGTTADQAGPLLIDSSGVIYYDVGVGYVGPSMRLSAVMPDGTLKWFRDFPSPGPGYTAGAVRTVLSYDESSAYLGWNDIVYPGGYLAPYTVSLATTTGGSTHSAYYMWPVVGAAPWGAVYFLPNGSPGAGGTLGLTSCTTDLQACNVIDRNLYTSLSTLLKTGIVVGQLYADVLLRTGWTGGLG